MPDLKQAQAIASDETRIAMKKFDYLTDLRLRARNHIQDTLEEKELEHNDLSKEIETIKKIFDEGDWESAALRGYMPKQLQKEIAKLEEELAGTLPDLDKIKDIEP